MNVTQWFSAGVLPVHVGVYQINAFLTYSYWDGFPSKTIEGDC